MGVDSGGRTFVLGIGSAGYADFDFEEQSRGMFMMCFVSSELRALLVDRRQFMAGALMLVRSVGLVLRRMDMAPRVQERNRAEKRDESALHEKATHVNDPVAASGGASLNSIRLSSPVWAV